MPGIVIYKKYDAKRGYINFVIYVRYFMTVRYGVHGYLQKTNKSHPSHSAGRLLGGAELNRISRCRHAAFRSYSTTISAIRAHLRRMLTFFLWVIVHLSMHVRRTPGQNESERWYQCTGPLSACTSDLGMC